MLDRLSIDYAGYIAPIEWHISSSYPLYNAEGRAKMRMYPPPYQGGYATPWAWIDGHNCSYDYNGWGGYVSSRMLEATDVRMYLGGTYNPDTREGTIEAVLYNQGMMPVDA